LVHLSLAVLTYNAPLRFFWIVVTMRAMRSLCILRNQNEVAYKYRSPPIAFLADTSDMANPHLRSRTLARSHQMAHRQSGEQSHYTDYNN
jgi:hypothetical protein